jgi:hypothetical protein
MGGRCVIGNRRFGLVLDLDDFDKVDPSKLIKKRRIIYAPTLPLDRLLRVSQYFYKAFSFEFENDILVYSYANTGYHKVILIYDLRLESIFPVNVIRN